MTRVIASIEARMSSSRYPGKVLSDIFGKPALSRMIERVRRCQAIDDIVVATTTNPLDDAVEEWAQTENVNLFRGSEEDVLNRVVKAHQKMKSDVVVELTGDCPLIDSAIVDLAVQMFDANKCDVVTTTQIISWPQGVDVQVYSLSILEDVEQRITDPSVREHVSLYFYENPQQYHVLNLLAPSSLNGPEYRFQLDYFDDYRFINEVYRLLEGRAGNQFGTYEVLRLLERKPELAEINAHCEERPVR